MRSLKTRLIGLWALSLVSSLVLGFLLISVFRQSTEARLGRTQAVLARACDIIRDRYSFYNAGGPLTAVSDPALRRDLVTLLDISLSRQEGVAGGIWSATEGALAYADPTGAIGPPSETTVADLNATALREDRTTSRKITLGDDTILLAACPLDGPLDGVTGWTQSRIRAASGIASLQTGLIVLLVLLVLISVLLGRTLLVWGRQIRTIEATLGRDTDGGYESGLPPLPRSGERELDRIVDALNLAGSRLAQARRTADAMAGRAAQAERLAALGRVAAGVAHEIRNPLAAARLQGENALAGDDRRRQAGIADMLEQLDRLDALVSELLAMTQRVDPAPTPIALPAFLAATAARHAETAAARGLTLATTSDAATATLDPAIVSRILDNLLSNAIRHAAASGTVTLAAHATPGLLSIAVSDDGAGVVAEMADRLFEPFVTSRPDGTGLGLAIARELADAHGGRLVLRDTAGLTTFALELPDHA